MKNARIRKFFDLWAIVFFLLVIFAPPLKTVVSPGKTWSEAEKRKLAVFPEIKLRLDALINFPKQFEKYYNDHFGFRDFFVTRYNKEMKARFGITGSERVIAGKDGWYFYAEKNLLEDFRGLNPQTNEEMEAFRIKQNNKKKWLAERGVRYLYFFAPNKQTIYPEYLPDFFYKAKGQTRLEQLEKYLLENNNERIINLAPCLYDAKHKMRLYDKTDTHWNLYGAYIAYNEIIKHISSLFPKESFQTDFTFLKTMREGQAGNLSLLLGPSLSLTEMRPIMKYKFCAVPLEIGPELNDLKLKHKKNIFMKGCKNASLQAVVFRDSFFFTLEPFFSQNFKRVIYIWDKYAQEDMERILAYFQPDIVIEERVELRELRKW